MWDRRLKVAPVPSLARFVDAAIREMHRRPLFHSPPSQIYTSMVVYIDWQLRCASIGAQTQLCQVL